MQVFKSWRYLTVGLILALIVLGGIATAIAQSTNVFNLNSPASFPVDIYVSFYYSFSSSRLYRVYKARGRISH